jgi:type IV secretion system protein VirD4
MAEGGGSGLTTLPVLQSLAQARDKWGRDAAAAVWGASIVKIVLGGGSDRDDLQDLSTLIGERDELTDSTTIGDHGTRSSQRSIRRVPIMPPDTIRTLPQGTALVLLRSTRPIVTRMRQWTERPEGEGTRLLADREGIEELLQHGDHGTDGSPA